MLSTLALACYLAAALWLISSMRQAAPATIGGRRLTGLCLSVAAVSVHAIVLWQGVSAKPEFALSIAETASLVGFGIALIAVLACVRQARFAGASAILLAIAGLVAVTTNEGSREFAVTQQGWELNIHIALSVLAYSLITVGTGLAIALTFLDRRLRHRQPLGWFSILPSVATLESGMFNALGGGFAALSLALFSGFFFIDDIFAQSLSRKVILSCAAWITLGALLFGRWRFGWRGRMARNWTLGGYFLLVLAYFGSKLVLENVLGRHWG